MIRSKTFLRKATLVALFSITTILMGGMFVSQAFAFTSPTPIAQQNITVSKPAGTTYWRGAQTIKWADNTAGLANPSSFTIKYSTDFSVYGNTIPSTISVNPNAGTYDWDVSSLNSGSSYGIEVIDSSGNYGMSSKFGIDNVAPMIGLSVTTTSGTGPALTGWYNSITGAPTITLTCTDNLSGCSSISYGWYNTSTGAMLAGSATTTVDFNSSALTNSTIINSSNISQGDNTLLYYSEDNAVNNETPVVHNIETTQTREFKVDTIAPIAPVISLPTYINSATVINVAITGAGNEVGDTVNYTLTDSATSPHTITGTATVDSSGNISFSKDLSSFADGQVTLTATLTDVAGNTGAVTTTTATKDTVAPVTSGAPDLTAATDIGSSSSDNVTNDNTPDYYIASCDIGNTVTIYATSTPNGSAQCMATGDGSGSGNATITTNTTLDGTYNVSFTETDPAGNESLKSSTLDDVIIDTAAPVAPVVTGITDDTGEFTNDGITKDTDLFFDGTANTDVTNVEVFIDGVSKGTTAVSSNAWSFDYTGTTLAEGTYAVTAKASDLAGNQSGASSVFNLTVDTTKPEVSTATATPDPAKDGVVTVTVKFNENMDPVIPTVKILGITRSPITVTQTSFTGDTWVGTFTLADNNENATAVISVAGAIDIAGNMMNSNASAGTFVVDTVDPNITDFDSPAVDTVYRTDPVLDFTPGDIGGVGTLSCSYSLDGGAQVPVTTCTAGTATGSTETIPGLTDGRHTVAITVTDAAGNSVTSTPVSFVYDNNHVLTVDDTLLTSPDFSTIQGAIDASVTGITTIQVAPGTYGATNVDKPLIIKGNNAGTDPNAGGRPTESTIFSGSGNIVTISSDNVTIDGFTMTNTGGASGVGIYSSDNSNLTIKNNIIGNIGSSLDDKVGRGIVIVSSLGATTDVNNVSITNNKIKMITSGLRTAGNSTSASGISVGWSNGPKNITGLTIDGNTITNIKADTSPWIRSGTKGQGAYGILLNHGNSGGQTIGAQITNNTISNLEGLWAHAIGLEGDTPNAVVTGNVISGLTDHKSPSDAVGVWVEDNPGAGTVKVNQNKFSAMNVGVALKPTTSVGVLDATNNWWGNATGPYNANANPAGLGSAVWPSVDDSQPSYVDFSPFCTDTGCTTLGSVDPIASFVLAFSPPSQAVNNSATLTVTAKDAGGVIVVNDTTTKMNIAGDNGASFGSILLTMGALGTTGTTITNTITGPVHVTATEVGSGTATGAGMIEFTNSDIVGPNITGEAPIDGTAVVSINAVPYLQFNEPLKSSTVNSTNIQLRKYSDNSQVTAVVALVEGDTKVTISPISPLDYSTQYYITASDNVTDPTGNALTTVYDSSTKADHEFTTAADTGDHTAPTLSTTNPVNGATSVPADSNITVTFSEALDATTVSASSVQLLDASNNPVGATLLMSDGNKKVVMMPNSNFDYSAIYHVDVTSAITDVAGNVFAGLAPATTFTIESAPVTDTTAPLVTGTNPSTGATGVAITVRPTITFDDVLDATTVDSVNVILVKNSDSSTVPAVVALVEGGKTIQITPNSNLENGVVYHVQITSDAKNEVGLPFAGSTNVTTFTTETITPFTVDSVEAIASSATADGTYLNGWHYVYHLTVNSGETKIKAKFSDWVNSDGTSSDIAANGNMRALFNTVTGGGMGSVVGLTEANITDGFGNVDSFTLGNAYTDQAPSEMVITPAMDTNLALPGIQVRFDVFTKLPVGTAPGLYSTTYGTQITN